MRIAPKRISGRKLIRSPKKLLSPLEPLTVISKLLVAGSMPSRWKISNMLESPSLREFRLSPLVVTAVMLLPFTSIDSMSPFRAREMSSLIGASLEPPRGLENKAKKTAIMPTNISKYMRVLRVMRAFSVSRTGTSYSVNM